MCVPHRLAHGWFWPDTKLGDIFDGVLVGQTKVSVVILVRVRVSKVSIATAAWSKILTGGVLCAGNRVMSIV